MDPLLLVLPGNKAMARPVDLRRGILSAGKRPQRPTFTEARLMPFIDTPVEHHFPWYVRLFFWNQKRRYGVVLEPARLWGRSPRVFAALALLYGALDRRSSPIGPTLRSLVSVRVSQINWCAFCVDINSANVLKRGVEQTKLSELATFETSTLFSEREKAALSYAEAMTYSDIQPTVTHLDRLGAEFDHDAIIELTALIAFQNLSSKFNAALNVTPQGFCDAADRPAISSKI